MSDTERRTFFPEQPSFNSGHLPVGDGHEIYFEEYGNPTGPAVIFGT